MRTPVSRLGQRRLLADYHGQSLAEFAIALPVFLLLMLGIVDLGRGYYYNNLLSNMAREGARYAIVAPTDAAGVFTRVNNAAIGLDSSGPLTTRVFTNGISGGNARGNPITVTVQYTMSALTPVIQAFIPNGLRIEAGSTMLIEGNYS